jgi:hypothetical protein
MLSGYHVPKPPLSLPVAYQSVRKGCFGLTPCGTLRSQFRLRRLDCPLGRLVLG